MESEKIKKGLECCSMLMDNNKTAEEQDNACVECPYRENFRCSWNLDADALTLINELEKGNEALSFAVKQGFNDCQAKTLKQFTEKVAKRLININGIKQILDETLKEFINESI